MQLRIFDIHLGRLNKKSAKLEALYKEGISKSAGIIS